MHAAHSRFVYNIGLEQRKMWHPFKRKTFNVSYVTQARELTEARKAFPWLAEGSTVVQQGALRDLDRAYRNWWSNPAHFGPPSFRSRNRNQGFIVRDLTVRRLNRKWGTVAVPKAGPVKLRLTRPWSEITEATSARVTLSPSGQWHVSFTVVPRVFNRTTTGAVVGVDRGIAQTISTSDGGHFTIPSLHEGEKSRVLAMERRLARQVKGSKRREATKRKLNRLRDRLRSRRVDWIEKTTTGLVQDYDFIALEALNTKNMVKAPAAKPDTDIDGAFLHNGARAKAGLNRAIHASCWGELARRIAEKAKTAPEVHPVHIALVDPKNTSRACHKCGHTSTDNRKSQAVFQCTRCGHTAHADTNAARNILARALNTLPPDGRSTDVSATLGCGVKLKGAT